MGNVQFGLPYWSPISYHPIPMVEPYGAVVSNNIAAWFDPTPYSDIDLVVRKANADIVNTVQFANYMQNSGLNAPPSTVSIFGHQYFPYA